MFIRDPDNRAHVTTEVTPGCEWVLAGEGLSTRKFDGTCVMFDGSRWWARREVKPGKTAPADFVPLDTDDATGKTVGWEPAEQSSFAKYLAEATANAHYLQPEPGTYELCGPKINGNPERFKTHRLVRHGNQHQGPSSRSHDELREYLSICSPPIEGFVFHHPDGRMAKIKARDF